MNNTHEEAERILMLVKQLQESDASDQMQVQMIETSLCRAVLDGIRQVESAVEAQTGIPLQQLLNENSREQS